MYSDITIREISKLYESGISVQDIANKFNMPLRTAYYLLNSINTKMRTNGEAHQTYRLEDAVKLYQEGKSFTDLGKIFGVNPGGIYERFERNGIKIRSKLEAAKRIIPLSEYSNIITLYGQGESTAKIGAKYGVHKTSIGLILKSQGIKARRRCGGRPKKYTKEQELSSIKMYRSGASLQAVATNMNLSSDIIFRMLGKNNVMIREDDNKLYPGQFGYLAFNIRKLDEYRSWKKSIYARDGKKCKHCGATGGRFEVHHLKKFSDIMKEFLLAIGPNLSNEEVIEKCKSWEDFWRLNNGIVLCKFCHDKV